MGWAVGMAEHEFAVNYNTDTARSCLGTNRDGQLTGEDRACKSDKGPSQEGIMGTNEPHPVM